MDKKYLIECKCEIGKINDFLGNKKYLDFQYGDKEFCPKCGEKIILREGKVTHIQVYLELGQPAIVPIEQIKDLIAGKEVEYELISDT